jgi:pimeloyl-ACP methyl ester carboxylesterase
MLMHRRGYPPSPPEEGPGHDFDVDADDIVGLLETRPHVVAHSYGALGALIAAAREPERVRSLTLIEPALHNLVPGDPLVARFEQIGNAVIATGLDTDPAALREFLRLAGATDVTDAPLPDRVARAVRRAHGSRPPGDARLDLTALRNAGIPTLVASGGHHEAIERICDTAASQLDAERLVIPGAGHFVTRAAGFTNQLERFLASAGHDAGGVSGD